LHIAAAVNAPLLQAMIHQSVERWKILALDAHTF